MTALLPSPKPRCDWPDCREVAADSLRYCTGHAAASLAVTQTLPADPGLELRETPAMAVLRLERELRLARQYAGGLEVVIDGLEGVIETMRRRG